MKERIAIDAAVAFPALTLPWWLQLVESWMQFGVVAVTLVIVIYRLRIVMREYKNQRND